MTSLTADVKRDFDGMTSGKSGVSLRSIRSYEQRENEIVKANGEILQALAQTLDCRIEDLLTP